MEPKLWIEYQKYRYEAHDKDMQNYAEQSKGLRENWKKTANLLAGRDVHITDLPPAPTMALPELEEATFENYMNWLTFVKHGLSV